jgi:predicted metal-dependent peptidase
LDLRDEVKSIIAAAMVREPLLGLMLKRTWIYADPEVGTAETDGIRIFVNPEFLSSLRPEERKFALLHEMMHIVQRHPLRKVEYVRRFGKMLDPPTMNAVLDAKANQYLSHHRSAVRADWCIWPDTLERTYGVVDVESKSVEEIYEGLAEEAARRGRAVRVSVVLDVFSERECRGSGEGKKREALNEGDREDLEAKDAGEAEERLRRKAAEALATVRMAGRSPGGLERLVEELLRPTVDWRRLLRSALTKGVGRSVKRTWARPSRKLPDLYPGKETLRVGDVVALIDTSGSISEEELRRFVSEAYGILRETARVIVVPWDAKAYEPIVLKAHSDVRRLKLTGGGGTMMRDALELAASRFPSADRIVILSDWCVGDLGEPEVQALLRRLARKVLAFTTCREPPEFLERYKIEIRA